MHPRLGLEANALPLGNQPDPDDPIGLIHPPNMEPEGKALRHASLPQQAPRLGTRFLKVRPVASDFLEFLLRRGQRIAWEYDAAHGFHNGNPGKVPRTAPAVDGQGERPAHTGVVEGLHEMVGSDEENAIPVALLERDLSHQGADQIVTNFGREAAELDQRLPAADGFHAGRLLLDE